MLLSDIFSKNGDMNQPQVVKHETAFPVMNYNILKVLQNGLSVEMFTLNNPASHTSFLKVKFKYISRVGNIAICLKMYINITTQESNRDIYGVISTILR